LDSFIVDDNEVESSAPEDEGHGKKEKPPKKHRRRKSRKLDEDDLDLINENTGINLKKRKRLQKVADFVEGEEEGNAEPPRVKGEVQSEEDEDARHFVEAKKSAKADVEEESQTEQIDTTRKRIIDPPYRTTELTDK
jgi:transcription elongation factor SPT6